MRYCTPSDDHALHWHIALFKHQQFLMVLCSLQQINKQKLDIASLESQARMANINTAALRADMKAMQRSAEVVKELLAAQQDLAE